MKRVLTAAALIPVVLLIVFKAPLWLFALMVAAIIALALHEYLGIIEAAGLKPFRRSTYVAGVLPIILSLAYAMWHAASTGPHNLAYPLDRVMFWVAAGFLVAGPLVFGIPLVLRKDIRQGISSVASSFFSVVYISVSLSLLISLREDPFKDLLVIFILFSVWAGDIAAYYVGKNFGRHKLSPIVSPNKSWEGAIASIIASIFVAWLVFHFQEQISSFFWRDPNHLPFYGILANKVGIRATVSRPHVIVLGVITNIAAQFGDLFESALKRGAGVKDSGTLLPGHGGLLDRIDALLFAIPVVWYYANLSGILRPSFLQ
ncbi:MAG TPA: phosphatidate cytidylyltransferase [Candidatus Angelobacter sp.]|jgi:phosphatidate cytidylyltransferase